MQKTHIILVRKGTAEMLMRAYCLPGRFVAYLHYLFPRSYIEGVRSRRQRGEPLIHFLYSTAIYAAALYTLPIVLTGNDSTADERVPPFALGEAGGEATSDPYLETEITSPVPSAVTSTRNEGPKIKAGLDTASLSTPGIGSAGTAVRTSADWTSEIEAALIGGKAQRWKRGKERGYVVVSEPTLIEGRTCRNVAIAVDGEPVQPAGTFCELEGAWSQQ